MARIRSVHPGLFTDADFVGLSDAAQIFFIGLWTESDDFGAFEWKPVTLKMRLRGASTSPVEPLLEELELAGRIKKYEHDGRQYGVIRNFCRYQRPKFPKSTHFIPAHYRNFIGSTRPITEIVADGDGPVPRKEEKPLLMEDGGGRMEKKEKPDRPESPSPAIERAKPAAAKVYVFDGAVVRLVQSDFDRWKASFPAIPDLIAELEVIDAKFLDEQVPRDRAFGKAAAWLRSKHERLSAEQRRAPPTESSEEGQWRMRIKGFKERKIWLGWGPKPDESGCYAPGVLLTEFGYRETMPAG